MGILLPFTEEERMLSSGEREAVVFDSSAERAVDRKSELCKPESFAIRALGTVLLTVYVPYLLLKVALTG